MAQQPIDRFVSAFEKAVFEHSFIKMTFSRPAGQMAETELRNIFFRPVELKSGHKIQLNHRYASRDEAKNLDPAAAVAFVSEALASQWLNAELSTATEQLSLQTLKNGSQKLFSKPSHPVAPQAAAHDREKKRLIEPSAPYLKDLSIAGPDGAILKTAQDKWKQINKFLEIIDAALRSRDDWPHRLKIADMGAGKGYLTFALYDFLKNKRGFEPLIEGFELRPALVEASNGIAQKNGFDGLRFVARDILSYEPSEALDMLIALHACDTATDLAIAGGLRAEAKAILVAPCCHKQVRRDLAPPVDLGPIARHGILLERQAELLTDAVRALLLESRGYRSQVFEFVSSEHTAKNLMIVGLRTGRPDAEARPKIERLKERFGLKKHFLESVLER